MATVGCMSAGSLHSTEFGCKYHQNFIIIEYIHVFGVAYCHAPPSIVWKDPFLYGQLVILGMLHGAVRRSFLKLCIFEQLGPQASGQQCRGHQVRIVCAWMCSDPHTVLDLIVAPLLHQTGHAFRDQRFAFL